MIAYLALAMVGLISAVVEIVESRVHRAALKAERDRFDELLAVERRRVDDLLNRLQARSFEQYQAYQAEPSPAPEGRYLYDDTGLISSFEPLDDRLVGD
jgi:hypothetical protein